MSYPSINRHLEKQGATLDSATDAQLQAAFMAAFREDLPLGMAEVDKLVAKLHASGGDRVMLTPDAEGDARKQYVRLLCPDVPRRVLQEHYGVHFGFYNCHIGVAGTTAGALNMTFREQIEAQDPAFVDC